MFQTQRSLRESQAALLQRVEELTEQLKQERLRALELEGHLTTSSLSLQSLDKVHLQAHERLLNTRTDFVLLQLQERISDLEGERDLIKDNYNTLLER